VHLLASEQYIDSIMHGATIKVINTLNCLYEFVGCVTI